MTVMELAMQYQARPGVIYDIIYTLQVKEWEQFTKKGNRYHFTPEQLEMIKAGLAQRGYRSLREVGA